MTIDTAIEVMLVGAALFAAGVVFGSHVTHQARAGRPIVSLPKKSEDTSPPRRKVHPGSRKV